MRSAQKLLSGKINFKLSPIKLKWTPQFTSVRSFVWYKRCISMEGSQFASVGNLKAHGCVTVRVFLLIRGVLTSSVSCLWRYMYLSLVIIQVSSITIWKASNNDIICFRKHKIARFRLSKSFFRALSHTLLLNIMFTDTSQQTLWKYQRWSLLL